MKNIFVRGFVLALALTGFVASTQASTPSSGTKVSATADLTVPACAPNDPNACGID